MLEETNIPQSGQRLGAICPDNIQPKQPLSTGALHVCKTYFYCIQSGIGLQQPRHKIKQKHKKIKILHADQFSIQKKNVRVYIIFLPEINVKILLNFWMSYYVSGTALSTVKI